MASYHCTIKSGKRGKGSAHADYIAREGRYASAAEKQNELTAAGHDEYIARSGRFGRYEDLVYSESGNMPGWAQDSKDFWRAAEQYERANGRIYTEIEVALPNELSKEQKIELVREFIKEQLGEDHPYSVAIHEKDAALDPSKRQPHAHIMFSERKLDGIERAKEIFFKQAARPGRGERPEEHGAKKDRRWHEKKAVNRIREDWANIQNRYLERYGHEVRVDHRNLEDQKIEALERGDLEKARELNREPERHLGPKIAQHTIREVKAEMTKAPTKEEKIAARLQYYDKETTNEKSRQAALARRYKKDYADLQHEKKELDIDRIRENIPLKPISAERARKFAEQVYIRKAEKQIDKDAKTLAQQRRGYEKAYREYLSEIKKHPENIQANEKEKDRLARWIASVEKKEKELSHRKEQIKAKQLPAGSEKQLEKIAAAIIEKDRERIDKLHREAAKLERGAGHKVTPAELSKIISIRQQEIAGQLQKLQQQKERAEKRVITPEQAKAIAVSVYTKGQNKRLIKEQKRLMEARKREKLTPEEKAKLLSQIQSYNARAGELSGKLKSAESVKKIDHIAQKVMDRSKPYQEELTKTTSQIQNLQLEKTNLGDLNKKLPYIPKERPLEMKGQLTPGNVGGQSKTLSQRLDQLLQDRAAAKAPRRGVQARIGEDDDPSKKRGIGLDI